MSDSGLGRVFDLYRDGELVEEQICEYMEKEDGGCVRDPVFDFWRSQALFEEEYDLVWTKGRDDHVETVQTYEEQVLE